MKKSISTLLSITILLLLNACTHLSHHPDYRIHKPKVKYKPNRKNLGKMIKKLQGSPYAWGEEGPYKFDCSGFTYYLYGSMGIEIPRVAREQAKSGKYVPYKDLKYGDLIFFDTTKRKTGKITHVGIYLGNGWFTHASTSQHEVVYSNLNQSNYYKKRIRLCRRFLPEETNSMKFAKAKPWKVTKTAATQVSPSAGKTLKKNQNSSGTYYVQIGSFTGEPNRALLTKLRHNGYLYRMIKFPRNGKEISKLLIAPYKTKAIALSVLPLVKRKIVTEAFITRIL